MLLNILGLKNFRVFDDENGFMEELSSINLLTGANNSGKSSVIKAIQMIKNSVELNKIPFDLDFTRQEHLLGDINNVLFNKENNIVISLPFMLFGIESIYISMSFEVPTKKNIYKAKLRKIEVRDKDENEDVVLFLFNYREATEEEKQVSRAKYEKESEEYEQFKKDNPKRINIFSLESKFIFPPIDSTLVSFIDWEINTERLFNYLTELKEIYIHYLNNEWSKETILKLDKKNKRSGLSFTAFINSFKNKLNVDNWGNSLKEILGEGKIINGSEKISESDFDSDESYYPSIPVEIIFYDKTLAILKDRLKWKDKEKDSEWEYSVFEYAFQNQWKYLLSNLSSINYLSNIREDNNRIYNATNNTPFVNLLKEYYTLGEPKKQFINKYLKSFEIGKEIKIEYLHKYQLISVSVTSLENTRRELVDFGYGIKQLIIMLIQIGVLAEKNERMIEDYNDDGEYTYNYYEPSTLLIEEPETNLHPKWQSLLAEMFVESNVNFNIQLIIETHSEYLIRKFQTLVAQNKIKGEDIKIFYLRNPQNISADLKQVETIHIEQDGSINYHAFDKGFFDENDTLELSLLNIQRDKFRNEFEELKKNNKDNENKITELEQKIDDFTSKLDIGKYEIIINQRFDTTKLLSLSMKYLVSGQFLLNTIDGNADFSPVIIQYGRTVENELKPIFIAIGITDRRKLMLGCFQGALEKYKTGTTTLPTYSISQLSSLPTELSSRFATPRDLKIELLNDIREKRNNAGHSGQTKTRQDAIDYINIVNEFLEKWIIEKR